MATKTQSTINPQTHHERTGARRTSTPEQATPRPAPSVAQVLATQKADQTIDRAGNVIRAEQPLLAAAGDAFDRHLDELTAGSFSFPGTLFHLHGVDGTCNIIGEDTEIAKDRLFVGLFDDAFSIAAVARLRYWLRSPIWNTRAKSTVFITRN
jgi:hypothetical protein